MYIIKTELQNLKREVKAQEKQQRSVEPTVEEQLTRLIKMMKFLWSVDPKLRSGVLFFRYGKECVLSRRDKKNKGRLIAGYVDPIQNS